jgi:hypothetical protein
MSVQVYDRPRTAGWRPYLFAIILVIVTAISGVIGYMSLRAQDHLTAPAAHSDLAPSP